MMDPISKIIRHDHCGKLRKFSIKCYRWGFKGTTPIFSQTHYFYNKLLISPPKQIISLTKPINLCSLYHTKHRVNRKNGVSNLVFSVLCDILPLPPESDCFKLAKNHNLQPLIFISFISIVVISQSER